uniref:S-acyltransferase n=1 Tax=Fagus sylvatica TaxID=28930 RepID=A0A2N9EL55_FAGSY
MVRKHGWQLPAHTFQVVAITVFCLLVVAFYAFFAPFLGGRTWEYILVATYSPVALLVFILYVRCTAINPADPGIMSKFDRGATNKLNTNHGLSVNDLPRKFDEIASGVHSSPSSASKSSIAGANSSRKGSVGEVGRVIIPLEPTSRNSCSSMGGIFCALFVHEDCRKQEGTAEEQGTGEEALFCTLCNAEVVELLACWKENFTKHQ